MEPTHSSSTISLPTKKKQQTRNDYDIVKRLLMKYNPELLDSVVGPEDGS